MSRKAGQIDFVGPPLIGRVYEPVMAGLDRDGYRTRWWTDPGEYRDGASYRSADIIVGVGALFARAEILDDAPRLRALVSPVTGTDAFDEPAATGRGVLVVNGQIPENFVAMAEATVLFILASLYDLDNTQRILRENAPRPEHLRARMLRGRTVGLIGFGHIAQSVALRLMTWDCRLLARVQTPRALPEYVTPVTLDELLATSDVVVVQSALNAETRRMLDAAKLRLMKPDVVFVNVSRGQIVDEAALAELARERPGMRIALDVFEKEPLDPASPLRDLPNAILTPHMIGHTHDAHLRFPVVLRENIDSLMAGRVPAQVRNPAIIADWSARWGSSRSEAREV